jgi:uncharacterized protein YcbK (DUF882 family)
MKKGQMKTTKIMMKKKIKMKAVKQWEQNLIKKLSPYYSNLWQIQIIEGTNPQIKVTSAFKHKVNNTTAHYQKL